MHANLFKKNLVTRQTVANITFLVHTMYSFLQTKNARKFMKHLHEKGEISDTEYKAWKQKQKKVA